MYTWILKCYYSFSNAVEKSHWHVRHIRITRISLFAVLIRYMVMWNVYVSWFSVEPVKWSDFLNCCIHAMGINDNDDYQRRIIHFECMQIFNFQHVNMLHASSDPVLNSAKFPTFSPRLFKIKFHLPHLHVYMLHIIECNEAHIQFSEKCISIIVYVYRIKCNSFNKFHWKYQMIVNSICSLLRSHLIPAVKYTTSIYAIISNIDV